MTHQNLTPSPSYTPNINTTTLHFLHSKTKMTNPLTIYGFTPVPASAETLLTSTPAYPRLNPTPTPIPVSETPIPTTNLAQRINAYARAHLPEPTYNHSLRVYHYGLAIKKHRFAGFNAWDFSDETYFLACVLHDIGTTEENLHKTRMSFEFYGGFLALEILQKQEGGDDTTSASAGSSVAPREQAESVAEAIIRHQDLCTVGKITAVGQLLQLATIFGKWLRYETLPFRAMSGVQYLPGASSLPAETEHACHDASL